MPNKSSEIDYVINNTIHKILYTKQTQDLLKKDISKIKNKPKVLFIFDKNVNNKITSKINHSLKRTGNKIFQLSVTGGKENKDSNLLFKIINILNKNRFTKNSIIVSLGGGVVGDVASFAAAIYMRGIYYFHIPSTMTSILDSCIGGKTAINYDNKINLLGTYYHPYRVYISHEILKEIPDREFRSGFAEAIKCGVIDDKKILTTLDEKFEEINKRNFEVLKKICLKVLKTKIKFFIKDVREKNKRLFLNFGHTFAHAIEMASSLNKKYQINHGEAVAIGIVCEMKYGNTNDKFITYIEKILRKYQLPKEIEIKKISKNIFAQKIYGNLFLDKKRVSKYPRYIKINNLLKPEIKEIKNFVTAKKIIKEIIKK
jgi:3-dehydroquinate synthase